MNKRRPKIRWRGEVETNQGKEVKEEMLYTKLWKRKVQHDRTIPK